MHNLLLESILLDSKKIKHYIKEGNLSHKQLGEINKKSFEIFQNAYEADKFFAQKVDELSQFVKMDLSNINNLRKFFHGDNRNIIDKFKYLIIISNIQEFLSLVQEKKFIESGFIRRARVLDFFLEKSLFSQKQKQQIKLGAIGKKTIEFSTVLELVKLHNNIIEEGAIKNKKTLDVLKMKAQYRKSQFIQQKEKLESEGDSVEDFLEKSL